MWFIARRMKNVNRHLLNNDQDKDISTDDVFCKEHYQQPAYRIVDAIEAHKQTHQPTMLDALHMPLLVTIEMDMTGEKEVRKVPDFQKLVKLNHSFDHGQQRSILFFSNEQVSVVAAGIPVIPWHCTLALSLSCTLSSTEKLGTGQGGRCNRGRRHQSNPCRSQGQLAVRRLRIHCGPCGHHDGADAAARPAEAAIPVVEGANGRHRFAGTGPIVHRRHLGRGPKGRYPKGFRCGQHNCRNGERRSIQTSL